MRRAFTAVLATETNTFSPIRVDLRAFADSLLVRPGEHPDTPTLCSAVITTGRVFAEKKNWQLIEGTAAWADPAGIVSTRTYELLRDEILQQLQAGGPFDVVVLGLHGAMVADGYLDPEGDFLERVRSVIGPEVPLIATLDPHSHLTARRVAAADILIAFKEFPHTDFVTCANDAWTLAEKMVSGDIRPVMSVYDCKMIDVFPTSEEPMRGFVDRMVAREMNDKQLLSLSVIHGFMAGDVPEMGTKVIAITDNDAVYGASVAKALGQELFSLRGLFRSPELSPDDALDKASTFVGGPVVVADMWDNPGGGTAGDATIILAKALERGLERTVFATIWDPVAVRLCHAAGEEAELMLRFGAKSAPGTGMPIDARVRVLKNVRSATQRFGDSIVPIGDASLIKVEGIEVILNSTRAQCFDTSIFEAFDIDPTIRKLLVIKSTNHFHTSFARTCPMILYCSAGAAYPNDPCKTDYRHAPKDIWPIMDRKAVDDASFLMASGVEK